MIDYLAPYYGVKETNASLGSVDCFSLDALMTASKKCEKGTIWKESVQEFVFNRARNCCRIRQAIMSGTYQMRPSYNFHIIERGKERLIKAISIYDRVPQRSVCDNLYIPLLQNVITENNAACLPGRGMHYALRNVGRILRGLPYDFWYVKFDFKSYFNSIDHNRLKDIFSCIVPNERVLWFMSLVIDYDHPDPENPDIGIELGSPINQMSGLLYLNQVDQMVPELDGVLGYQRYMDDGIVFCKDKDTCKRVLSLIYEIADALNIGLNQKKTFYNKSTQPFVFLKKRFRKLKNGRYEMIPTKKVVKRVKKKLDRVMANPVVEGKDIVLSSYYGYLNFGTYDMFDEALEVAIKYPEVLTETRYSTKVGKMLYDYAVANGVRIEANQGSLLNLPGSFDDYSVAQALLMHDRLGDAGLSISNNNR